MDDIKQNHNIKMADDIIDKFWDFRLTNAPEYATSLGIHKYDDRLDEMNLNAYSRFEAEAGMLLEEVKEVVDACSGDENNGTSSRYFWSFSHTPCR